MPDLKRHAPWVFFCLVLVLLTAWWLSHGSAEQLMAPPATAAWPTAPSAQRSPPAEPVRTQPATAPASVPDSLESVAFIDAAALRDFQLRLESASNYRALIHQVLAEPSTEGLIAARRAWERCHLLKIAHLTALPTEIAPDIAASKAQLEQRCSQSVQDQTRALSAASRKQGLHSFAGDEWIDDFVKAKGFAALVALGDGDLVAAHRTYPHAVDVYMVAPDVPSGLFAAAWIAEACQRWSCDTSSARLKLCLLLHSCAQTDLSGQLLASTGASEQQWQRALDLVRKRMAELQGGA